MYTLLAWGGRLFAPLLGAAVPGLSPAILTAIASILVGVVAIGGPAGAVWLNMQSKVGAATKVANAACELRISESARAAAESMTHLLDRISKEEGKDEPSTSAEEAALCKKSKLCRSGKR